MLLYTSLLPTIGLNWQRWAVYQRSGMKNAFQYSIDDFIKQNLLHELSEQYSLATTRARTSALASSAPSASASADASSLEASVWGACQLGLIADEETEVEGVMAVYYSAFNRGNFDRIRSIWLPDDNVELLLPGHSKAVRETSPINYTNLISDVRLYPSWSLLTHTWRCSCFNRMCFIERCSERGENLPATVQRGSEAGESRPHDRGHPDIWKHRAGAHVRVDRAATQYAPTVEAQSGETATAAIERGERHTTAPISITFHLACAVLSDPNDVPVATCSSLYVHHLLMCGVY